MATNKKLNQDTLAQLIKEAFTEMKLNLNEDASGNIEKTIKPLEVEMNKNDKTGDSTKALVYKSSDKTEEKSGKPSPEIPLEVEMNKNAEEKGSDEGASTAVAVEAGATKKVNGHTSGQAKAKFESKKGNPDGKFSTPFEEKAKDNMKKLDKLTDETTKTYVEAGSAKDGHTVTAGQHEAKISDKAPVSDKYKRIAQGIEIGTDIKESYTKTELVSFIKEQAKKLVKKQMIEEQIAKLNSELKNI